ncbi:MAG: DUF692 domain-containing protein [Cellvibrionaceae bacterium]|nr:DUF692 domain-containing protein [Cellvibrionaceae bacterium]
MEKLPRRAGISLQPQHYQEILNSHPDLGWVEIHPEDYLGLGGAAHFYLEKIASDYPLAMNCRSLSLGSAESVNSKHLQDIAALVERYSPAHFSEHLAWNRWQGGYFHQPLPLPYTTESLDQVSFNVRNVQNALGRRILLENPARFFGLEDEFSEGAFFSELVRSSGCGLLLDLTSLYLSCLNLGKDPFKELQQYPLAAIKEIHLGGHTLMPLDDDYILLVDDHSTAICKPVWQLYRETLQQLPQPVATLIEWDHKATELSVLLEQVGKANQIISEMERKTATGEVTS